MKLPSDLEHWTLDETAECLDLSTDLYGRLWGFVYQAPPKGEFPEPDSPDREVNFLSRYWNDLTDTERGEIISAYERY